MINKIKKIENLKYYLIVFSFFLIIGLLIPFTGDDWNNLLADGTLKSFFEIAKDSYFTFEGRFFSRISDLFFCHYKVLWAIVSSLGMTFIYFCILKFIDLKKENQKLIPLLVVLSLLLIDEETFSQVYVWVTGNCTYFLPIIFTFFIIYLKKDVIKEYRLKYNKFLYVVLPMLSFIFSMFVEPASVAILSVYLIIFIYQIIKYKKIDVLYLISFIFSLVGFILMLTSPGTLNRGNDMGMFMQLNIFEKIISCFPRQMNYVFIKNSFLILLTVVTFDILILKNIKSIKKYILIVYLSSFSLITSTINFICSFKDFNSLFGLKKLLDCSNIFILLYWLSFLIIIIYLVVKYINKDKTKITFFFLLALLNNASMLLSPLAGGRTSFFSTLMLIICLFIIINNIDSDLLKNKIVIRLSKILCTFVVIIFLSFYSYCKYLDIKRTKYINEQIKDDKEVIEVIRMPGKYLWNPNPWDEWHAYTFKLVYGIDPEKKLEIIERWK